jgi:cytochrome c oxidase subunit 4
MSRISLRQHLLTWVALLVLLGLSAGTSLLPLGAFNVVCNFAIAIVKAGLVVVLFMRIGDSAPMVKIVAAAGVFLLGMLIWLGVADFIAQTLPP